MKSVLTKEQVLKFKKEINGKWFIVTVRYDDRCGNGHNTFSITGDFDGSGGCIHDQIAKHFPELEKYIKWHLCSSDKPMYYIENTMYHALQHGPNKGHVYMNDPKVEKEMLIEYCSGNEWMEKYADDSRFRFKLDPKTEKIANLEHARSTAIWPDATLEQLSDEKALLARLPALMVEFKAAIEELGFTY